MHSVDIHLATIDKNRIQIVARLCGSVLIVTGITVLYTRVVPDVNGTTVALSFLLATLGIATRWGLREAIVASVGGMLCFNFFFLPPVGTWTIQDPQNWVALFWKPCGAARKWNGFTN
ncbi:MAG: hypothetical protein DMF60_15245 [Acidobacteria bacterium]|nr:MAG: hypothetical protein DMF60_15245 [Acidobacteriota bacterium]